MYSKNFTVVFLLIALMASMLILATPAISYQKFINTCDPSFNGDDPQKCFMGKFNFSEEEYEQLSDREKGLVEINTKPQTARLRSHNKTYERTAQAVEYYGYEGVTDRTVDFNFKASLNKNNFLELESTVTQEILSNSEDSYHYTTYYEVDNTETFKSILTYRYPALRPARLSNLKGGPLNITNFSGVELNVLSSSIRNMSKTDHLNSTVTIPFNHDIFQLETPIDRNRVDYGYIYELAQILGANRPKIEAAAQISNFLKMNLMWGGDSHARAPLDTFLSKVVECGHMNSLVGVMFEMVGGRFRYVSGHDPYLRPKKPNAGHALIEVYSEESGRWSILDTYFDIFTKNISTANVGKSMYKDLPVLAITEDRDGILTFGELFRHRNYSDTLSRRLTTSMGYIANNEQDFGLDWELAKFEKGSTPKKTNNKIYIRARVIATKCPIRYVDDLGSDCFGGAVSYSNWKTQTLDLVQK